MEKPGPRPATPDLIIEDPGLQSTGQKVLYGTLTVVFWALWIYLWLPLITLLGWSFGVVRFVDIMMVHEGLAALGKVLWIYLLVIAVLGGGLILWALYNWLRFAGKERRTSHHEEHSSPHLAKALGKRESVVLIWQNQKTLRVSHHPDGRIAVVETYRGVPQPAPQPPASPSSPADIGMRGSDDQSA